ncbi:hypothetical protein AMECASPLE_005013 [Ameca splendens]|uniref:Uncharacterized protein n=1 Tax=Ameca splendens TaxID=208324 RepID=A0ABV0XYY5_9TELE
MKQSSGPLLHHNYPVEFEACFEASVLRVTSLSPADQVQAGSFLALRPSGSSNKRTLSTLQPALMQVPPTCARHHLSSLITQSWIKASKDLPLSGYPLERSTSSEQLLCCALRPRISHPFGGSTSSPSKHRNQLASQVTGLTLSPIFCVVGDLPVQDLKPLSLP